MLDCIIIGGGPGGLTTALYLARFLRSVTVLDGGVGRTRMIPRTHNLAPFPDGISGPDLLRRMRASAELYGASLLSENVVSVARHGDVFSVTTNRQNLEARFLVLATGVFNHRPPLSEVDHDRGLSQGLIRYCPVCDAFEVRDKRIAVLGSGQHGLSEAQFLSHYSPFVTLVPPEGYQETTEKSFAVADAPVADLSLSATEVLVTLVSGKILSFDTLYVALGTTPCSDLARMIGAKVTKDGHVEVDAKQRTSLNRVFAVGDLTDGLDQVAVAMGQAAIAATAIHNDLLS